MQKFLFVSLCAIIARSSLAFTHSRGNSQNEENFYGKGCTISVKKGLSEPQPLLLDVRHLEFVYPGGRNLTLKTGAILKLACPGGEMFVTNVNVTNSAVSAKCVSETTFTMKNQADFDGKFSLENVTCSAYPIHVIKQIGKTKNHIGTYEVGFVLEKDFYYLYDIVHDLAQHNTLLAHVRINSAIGSSQTSFPRKSFRKDGFFKGLPIDNLYNYNTQQETFGRILGNATLGQIYVDNKSYLARGHLVAKTDFVYGTQQRSTFSYANTVPMWSGVNGGNWKAMEINVRNYASDNRIDLDTFTGGIGVLELPDSRGRLHEMYLYFDENGNVAVPVPKILFKVVYAPKKKAGVVFLSANNPFLTELSDDYVLCDDICDQLEYITWKADKGAHGLSYCCDIDDFRAAYPDLPEFVTYEILL